MKESEKNETKKLFNFRPIFFAAVALCFGILFSYLHKFYDVSAWWLSLTLPLAGASFCFCANRKKIFRAALAWLSLCLFFAVGFFGLSLQLRNFQRANVYAGEYYVVGTVVERKEYDYNACLVLDDVFIDGEEVKGKLNAYLPLSFYKETELCDEVLLFGDVRTDTEFFGDYGFRSYAIGENLSYSVYADDCAVTGDNFDLGLYLRAHMQSRIDAGMDKDAASVTMAVLTGETSGIDEGLLDNMRRGGIAHIFAVSGLHVGALYAFCLLLLNKTKLKVLPKAGRFCLLAVILLFYGWICGFSDSIVRAIVLCLVSYAAKQFSSSVDFLETIGFSAILILLFSPVALFEVGFQLSFSACLGIVLLQKRIEQVCVEIGKGYRKLFPRRLTEEQKTIVASGDTLPPTFLERTAQAVASVLSVSLAAQIATAPIQLANFGYISGWSLLLNVVFVPVISAAFAFLLLLAVIACLLPVAANSAVLYLPSVVWSFVLLLFETVDLSGFSLVGWSVSPQTCICYYGGWILLTDKFHLSAVYRRVLSVTCFVAFIFLFLAGNL